MDNGLWLVICGTDPKLGAFRIQEGVNVIGRGSNCDIHLPHPKVSRPHAILVNEDGKLLIRDLGSRNGTFVDGTPVRSATIKVGSSLRIGRVLLDVVDHVADRSPLECDAEETDRGTVDEPADVHLRASFATGPEAGAPTCLEGLHRKADRWAARHPAVHGSRLPEGHLQEARRSFANGTVRVLPEQ